jgi:anaerobic ribonucleoside-triphosphate reductase activating protein
MKLLQVYHADLLNGEGLREVLFFSGCDLRCPQCFNKEAQNPNYSMPDSHDWCENDFNELVKNLRQPFISGTTILGGDGFSVYNRSGVLELCKKLKETLPEKTIWLYTGYTWENIIKAEDERTKCLKYIDVLCDGPFIAELKSPEKPWVGSSNQRVIDVKKSLNKQNICLLSINY